MQHGGRIELPLGELLRGCVGKALDRGGEERERGTECEQSECRCECDEAHASGRRGRVRRLPVQRAPPAGEPDLTLTISPLRLPALLAQPARWPNIVHAQGDAALASTLAELASTAPLFAEQALAKVVGPVIASQVAIAGASVAQIPEYAAQRVGDSVADYVGEHTDAAVSKAEAHAFASDVAALSADVDALAARVEAAIARSRVKR